METLIEGLLGICMVCGVLLRITVPASSGLLIVLGIAMSVSLGFGSQFPFAVFVLATGAWVLAHIHPVFLSIDSAVARSRKRMQIP